MGIKVLIGTGNSTRISLNNQGNKKSVRTLIQPSLGIASGSGVNKFVNLTDVISSPVNTGDVPAWNASSNTLIMGPLDGGLY